MGKRTQEQKKDTVKLEADVLHDYSDIHTERNYKDRLFRKLFGNERYKEHLLTLYNALNQCDYTDTEELEITTIENVIYIGMKNDASFLLHGHMVLYEHQYSYNPNMPLRGLLYISKLYQKYIEQREYSLYGSKLIKIPAPQYVIFYNGDQELPDKMTLKLSEAFEKPVEEGTFEWTATMLNINFGKNQELLERCRVLKEYAMFIDRCKSYIKTYTSVAEAINKAVDECISENVLKEFLIAHRGEVLEVLLTEFDEAKYTKAIKQEGYETGYSEGQKSGFHEGQAEERQKNIKSMIEILTEDGMDLESVIINLSKKFQLTTEEIRKIVKEL